MSETQTHSRLDTAWDTENKRQREQPEWKRKFLIKASVENKSETAKKKSKKAARPRKYLGWEKNNYLRNFLGDGVLVSSIFEYCFDNNVKRNPDDEI